MADPCSDVARGRDNWLLDGYSDTSASLPAAYRKPVEINNWVSSLWFGQDKKTPEDILDGSDSDGPDISGPKVYLLKLVEFNKIALLEQMGFGLKPTANQHCPIFDFLCEDPPLLEV